MAMLDVDGSSLPTDSQPKLNGLVWGLVLSLYSSNEPRELPQWLWAILLLAHLQLRAVGGLIKCSCSFFSLVNDSVRPSISTSTGPIFTQFARTPELCIVEDERPEAIFFDSLRNHAVANNFAGNIDLQSTHSTWVRVPSARSRCTARSAITDLLIKVFY